MYICFSDKESQSSFSFANEFSDGDDIPLSALARSRSEPDKNSLLPMHRHSVDDSARRSNTMFEDHKGGGVDRKSMEEADGTERMVRSTSMDARAAGPITSPASIKRRFGRWKSFF